MVRRDLAAPSVKKKVLACSSIRDELLAVAPAGTEFEFLEYGYHRVPGQLLKVLQEKIDAEKDADVVILGYGLCSNAVVGLVARQQVIVVPRVHDCIALLLGSRAEYETRFRADPGTYYLSKGWIDYGSDPYKEYLQYKQRYGEEAARWMIRELYRNYHRICLIKTLEDDWERLRGRARQVAEFMRMEYAEATGSLAYISKLLTGPWPEHEFVRVAPGEVITQSQFL
jgi:hypothetical protein